MPSAAATETQYVDSTVLARRLFRWEESVPFDSAAIVVSSELIRVELVLLVDRRRPAGNIDEKQAARFRADVDPLLRSIHLFPVSEEVLAHALEPFPLGLYLNQALHVATALLAQEHSSGLTFWSHHQAQGGLKIGSFERRLS